MRAVEGRQRSAETYAAGDTLGAFKRGVDRHGGALLAATAARHEHVGPGGGSPAPVPAPVVLPALLRGGALLRDEPRGEQAHGREGHRRAHDGQRNRDGASLRAR